ncbi:M48 family peptidase, partial [Candidatus Parcubacteria bacterium]
HQDWITQALAQQIPRQAFLWGELHALTCADARDALQAYLSERLPVWTARMDCEPSRMVITNMKSRWSSCPTPWWTM